MGPRKVGARKAKARRASPPFVATLTVEVGAGPQGTRRARALVDALSPEAGKSMPGSAVKVRKGRGGVVEVVIEADTMAILRAAVNSYLRVASLAERVAQVAWQVAPGA